MTRRALAIVAAGLLLIALAGPVPACECALGNGGFELGPDTAPGEVQEPREIVRGWGLFSYGAITTLHVDYAPSPSGSNRRALRIRSDPHPGGSRIVILRQRLFNLALFSRTLEARAQVWSTGARWATLRFNDGIHLAESAPNPQANQWVPMVVRYRIPPNRIRYYVEIVMQTPPEGATFILDNIETEPVQSKWTDRMLIRLCHLFGGDQP